MRTAGADAFFVSDASFVRKWAVAPAAGLALRVDA
jgi:hypothetical protein